MNIPINPKKEPSRVFLVLECHVVFPNTFPPIEANESPIPKDITPENDEMFNVLDIQNGIEHPINK